MVRALVFKLFRFGLTGAVCSLLYAVLAHSFIKIGGLDPVFSSTAAYGLTIPVSFIGQKYFTFRARGKLGSELQGFILLHAAGLMVATALMATVESTSYDPLFGILAVMIAVPLLSFLLMNTYVFKKSESNS